VYSYRAAVVEQHQGQMATIHVETKLANSRGEALDKLLEILEDIAEEKLSKAAEEGMEEAAKAIEEAGSRNAEIKEATSEALVPNPSRRGLARGKQAELPVIVEEEPKPEPQPRPKRGGKGKAPMIPDSDSTSDSDIPPKRGRLPSKAPPAGKANEAEDQEDWGEHDNIVVDVRSKKKATKVAAKDAEAKKGP
jgi:hypothetical protein